MRTDNAEDRPQPAATPEQVKALADAVRAGRIGEAVELLRGGVSGNATDPETGEPLLFTLMDINNALFEDDARAGTMAAIFLNFFTNGHADPDIRNGNGHSALRYALGRGNHYLATLLVSMKADVHEKYADTGDTPLHDATAQALAGTGIRALNVLLLYEADASVKNDAGICAFDLAEAAMTSAATPQAAARAAEVREMLAQTVPVQRLLAARAAARQSQLHEKARRSPGLKLKGKPVP